MRLSGVIEPDDVIVLLTAPTGVAAFRYDLAFLFVQKFPKIQTSLLKLNCERISI